MSPEDAFAAMQRALADADATGGALELRQLPGKGRGVVATKRIPAGALLVKERAWAFAAKSDILATDTILAHSAVKTLGPDFWALSGGDREHPDRKDLLTLFPERAVDAAAIIQVNKFQAVDPFLAAASAADATRGKVTAMPMALLPKAACMVNHSCAPNAFTCNAGRNADDKSPVVTILAKHDIEPETEVTIYYGTCATLPAAYGFTCGCGRPEKEANHVSREQAETSKETCSAAGVEFVVPLPHTTFCQDNPGQYAWHFARTNAVFGGRTTRLGDPVLATILTAVGEETMQALVAARLTTVPWIRDMFKGDLTGHEKAWMAALRYAVATITNYLPYYLFLCAQPKASPPLPVLLDGLFTSHPAILDIEFDGSRSTCVADADYPNTTWNEVRALACGLGVQYATTILAKGPDALTAAMGGVKDCGAK